MNLLRPITKESAFTLIETLIIVAIVAILPTIVIANFSQIKLQLALTRTAHAFAQDVRRAQDMALSSTPYIDPSGNPQLIEGYGVYLDPSGSLGNKTYLLYADREPGDEQYDPLDFIVSTQNFSVSELGIVIKEIQGISGSAVSVNFNPPRPTTTISALAPGQNTITVVFSLESDPSRTRSVSISTTGLIDVN